MSVAADADDDHRPEARLGVALRRARQERGLSLRALARRLDRAHSNLHDYEKGNRLPPAEVVQAYEAVLEVAPGTLTSLHREVADELENEEFERRGAEDRSLRRLDVDAAPGPVSDSKPTQTRTSPASSVDLDPLPEDRTRDLAIYLLRRLLEGSGRASAGEPQLVRRHQNRADPPEPPDDSNRWRHGVERRPNGLTFWVERPPGDNRSIVRCVVQATAVVQHPHGHAGWEWTDRRKCQPSASRSHFRSNLRMLPSGRWRLGTTTAGKWKSTAEDLLRRSPSLWSLAVAPAGELHRRSADQADGRSAPQSPCSPATFGALARAASREGGETEHTSRWPTPPLSG